MITVTITFPLSLSLRHFHIFITLQLHYLFVQCNYVFEDVVIYFILRRYTLVYSITYQDCFIKWAFLSNVCS